jgi:hypothetical protein
MVQRGQRSLEVGENVVLTDLAYEKARRLGVQLVEPNEKPPAAPVRPYLSQPKAGQNGTTPATPHSDGSGLRLDAVKARVKSAVKAQMGNMIDDATLERIIERVAADLGLK